MFYTKPIRKKTHSLIYKTGFNIRSRFHQLFGRQGTAEDSADRRSGTSTRRRTFVDDSAGHRHLRALRAATHSIRGLHADLRDLEHDPELDADRRG